MTSTTFQYDPTKSAANKVKHGLNFDDAKALWDDPFLVELDARAEGEHRLFAIGRIGLKHWTAVFTYRGKVIRLISVRRARPTEIAFYDVGRA